jgi:UDPglucose--hexose-1-phosphate uridylyltransferase
LVPELRIDPLSGLRTIIAPDRAGRPIEVRPSGERTDPQPTPSAESDPFAEGNEEQTPPELYALRDEHTPANGPGWRVRAFENLYPALAGEQTVAERDANPDLFTTMAASGSHEVIVNSQRPVTTLAALSAVELEQAVDVWRLRMREHSAAACIHLIVNERFEGGTSIAHTHAQLYALEFVPALIARERERFSAYATRTMGQNLLGDLIQEEVRRRERIVAIDDEAVLIAPFASALPYQLMLAPRRPQLRFEDDGPTGAALLHDALARLERLLGESPPLNLWVRTAPRGAEHFCWRIDLLPRLTGIAGLELGTGVHLNSVAPERAAAELRAA